MACLTKRCLLRDAVGGSLRPMRIWRTVLALLLLVATSSNVGGMAAPKEGGERTVALADGRTIALRCNGRGRFTVLLEPGDGGRRTHMAALAAVLSRRYRVCDYDRRNVGRSSSAPVPRKASNLAADAFEALSAANVKGPLILFGSSMGGLLVRSYATSHNIAGFVTSNQPGTTREWTKFAYPLMSPSQQAMDAAWMAGDNNEHIDANDVSRTIDGAKPPSVPYVIMISTERFQCKAAGLCGSIYRAFVSASREAARAGPRGRLRLLDGDHDLYVTNLTDVVAAIDGVASAAASAE